MKRRTLLLIILVVILTVNTSFAGEIYSLADTSRISGHDRYETALAVAASLGVGNSKILVSGEDFADALSGIPLTSVDTPIILSKKDYVPHVSNDFFNNFRVDILGGKGVISEELQEEIDNSINTTTTRTSGKDRYETSLEIVKKNNSDISIKNLIIVNGRSYPDALSSSNLVGYYGSRAAVLLVNKNSIPKNSKDFISTLELDGIYIVGGKGVVSSSVENELKAYCDNLVRISGKNRYLTNLATIEFIGGINPLVSMVMVTGENYPDGLSAGVFNNMEFPIMLVGNELIDEQVDALSEIPNFDETLIVVGGKGAVSERIQYESLNYLNLYKWYELADGSLLSAKVATKEDSRDRLLSNINSYRAENGLAPLEYEYSWLPSCNLRAVETMVSPSPTRPDGSDFSTAFNEPKPVVEDTIIIGEGTHGLFPSLKSKEETNSHMLNPNFTKIMFCGVIDRNVFGFRFVLVYR